MVMSKAIDTLRQEHRAIMAALTILERMAAQAKQGAVAPSDIADFLDFLRDFADTCHHGKEEGLLFPAMLDAGVPEPGPVTVMLMEHARGRELIAAMRAASAPTLDPEVFGKAAGDYIELLRQHIEKEEVVLFPLAERIIDPVTLDELNEGFENHEEQVMGHGRHEALHAMLNQLEARYR